MARPTRTYPHGKHHPDCRVGDGAGPATLAPSRHLKGHHDRHHPSPNLPAVRGVLRPGTHRSRRPGPERTRPRRGRAQHRVHLPQGRRTAGPARGPGPTAHATHQAQWRVRDRQLARGVCRDRAPPARGDSGPWPRRGGRGGRQSGGPQDRSVAVPAAPAQGPGNAQFLQRGHAGPDSAPPRERTDVRPMDDRARAGRSWSALPDS